MFQRVKSMGTKDPGDDRTQPTICKDIDYSMTTVFTMRLLATRSLEQDETTKSDGVTYKGVCKLAERRITSITTYQGPGVA